MFSFDSRGSKMRILNFNIRLGGGKRTPQILNYLISNDFDLIVLTEFIKNKNIVNLLLYPKKIKWLGDGWYERKIGDEIKKKIIIGIPKI